MGSSEAAWGLVGYILGKFSSRGLRVGSRCYKAYTFLFKLSWTKIISEQQPSHNPFLNLKWFGILGEEFFLPDPFYHHLGGEGMRDSPCEIPSN